MSSTLRCVFSNDVLVYGVQLKICTILCIRQKFYQTNNEKAWLGPVEVTDVDNN